MCFHLLLPRILVVVVLVVAGSHVIQGEHADLRFVANPSFVADAIVLYFRKTSDTLLPLSSYVRLSNFFIKTENKVHSSSSSASS